MKEKIINIIKDNIRFIITLIIIIVIFLVELPFKVYSPGGMIDLNSRVSVEDGYKSKGTFGMAYVSVLRGTIPNLALSFIIPNWDIYSDDDLKNDNETMKERLKIDHLSTKQSISSAIISAYKLASKEVKINKTHYYISYIDEKSDTNALLLDELISVEGEETKGLESLKKIVESHQEGDEIELKVKRDEEYLTCYARVFLVDETPKIGMSILETYDYEATPEANITMKESESGPSGGLMMGLAVYNNLVEEDITKGFTIIGTGTIDSDGNIGAIGGVKYKLLGASKKKAEVFIVPKENYEEAVKVKEDNNLDITLMQVKTLKDAVEQLSHLE